MAFDFPNFPTDGLTITGPGGTRYQWNAAADKWRVPQPDTFATEQWVLDQITGTPIHSGPTAPASPNQGDLWLDTTTGTLMTWDGSAWVAATPGPVTGFLPLSGGVLSGNLTVLNPTATESALVVGGRGAQGLALIDIPGSQTRALNWQPNTYDGFNTATANRSWITNNADTMTLSAAGQLVTAGPIVAGGNGFLSPGSTYYFRFDWSGAQPRFSLNGGAWLPWASTSNLSFMGLQVGGGPVAVQLFCQDATGGVTYNFFADAISDARVKHAIADTEVDALAVLRQVPVRQFDYDDGDWHVPIGLVTQDIAELIPEMVGTAAQSGLQVLNQKMAVPYLIRAVQQLVARMEALEGARA